ncbi:hypothetical protein DFQ27_008170 [Actinomortierella ambigua]|uniref:JmjC domain-containing protein n=1 Tax=Actinomortierella ambigua TaxID=1343610 RepID=A0A9P6TZ59_9FUNG|nr:hypothetical protein DFQ27_008170 [Actinomortierella ambigua]
MSASSRYLFAFSRTDLLWKVICLDTWANDKDLQGRLIYRGTWLLTYLFPGPEGDQACAVHPLVTNPYSPQGVYSEYLQLVWQQSTMFFGHYYPPPPFPPTKASGTRRAVDPTIPLVDYSALDEATFYKRFGFQNKPVMLYNSGVDKWPSWTGWTMDNLVAKYGDKVFRVSSLDGGKDPFVLMCLKDFAHYVRYNRDKDPLYLFDPYFAEVVPEFATDYEVPKYFTNDYFALIPKDERPPHRWMLIGPQRTGAPWHTDPSGTSGHKRWALYPPHMVPPGYDPQSVKRLSSVEWYLGVYPLLSPEARPIEIVQHPGQTIYVPSGWWHMVLNLDDTVAVTQNYADETNLGEVKESLNSDPLETVQLERWELMAGVLRKERPDLIPFLEDSTLFGLPPDFQETEKLYITRELTSELEEYWHERVRQVIAKTDPSPAAIEDIESLSEGANVCFVTKTKFIKFFTPMFEGEASFQAEVQALQWLGKPSNHEPNKSHSDQLATPVLLDHGYVLCETDQAAHEYGWRWPYIITTKIDSPSVAAVAKPSLQQEQSGCRFESFGEAQAWIKDSPAAYTAIHESLAKTLAAARIQHAAEDHQRWRTLPTHLLAKLPAYLPTDVSQVFDPVVHGPAAGMVHGDLNPGNLLGWTRRGVSQFDVERATALAASMDLDDGEEEEDEQDDDDEDEGEDVWEDEEEQQKSTLASPPPPSSPPPPLLQEDDGLFEPYALIDFGDALLDADPLMDLVSIFTALLDSREDLGMQEQFWPLYNAECQRLQRQQGMDVDSSKKVEECSRTASAYSSSSSSPSVARRCLWHMLLWPTRGMTRHLIGCRPEIAELDSWEEVEQAVFGWWEQAALASL